MDSSAEKEFNQEEAETQQTKCTDCGGLLNFKPGTKHLKCVYCGAENLIEGSEEVIEEIDYEQFINEKYALEEKQEITTVKCNSCGASTTLKPNIAADSCPFCDTPLVLSSGSTSTQLKPKGVLPFKIDQNTAVAAFKRWVRKLWFAPSKLKQYANNFEKLAGIYIPYWTFDSNTTTPYSGMRGTYYYVTESYTTTENGRSVTKTRQVRKIRWTPCSGTVYNTFDDVLVLASNSLPRKYTERLEPWDLPNLEPFNENYLSGFKSETYQVDLPTGFGMAKEIMKKTITATIKRDIGGDEQRILSMSPDFRDVTFKHILLPIWVSAYRFKEKVYRFMVNARTGEVQGERPWSWIKITLTVLAGLIIIGGIIYLIHEYNK
ncbi:MAG: hypothetical protein KKA07_10045 [Bacteroidetes bacterium]|nr:hypothetical protein [Bacteroidota bacterium]MBU1719402.1 hypothetical protein [Bacteroidota bacterium]